MIERRGIPRYNISIKTEYARTNLEGERTLGCVNDISMKGLRLLASEEFKKNDLLDLFFYLPNKPLLETVGKVMWSRPGQDAFEAGLSFINIRDSVKEDIFEYVSKYFPQEIQKCWWSL